MSRIGQEKDKSDTGVWGFLFPFLKPVMCDGLKERVQKTGLWKSGF